MYDSLLSRSFSKQEKKKLGYGGLLLSFLLFFTFCTVFRPFFSPFPVLNLRLSIETGQKLNILNVTAAADRYFIFSNEIRRKNAIQTNHSSISQKLDTEYERRNQEPTNDTSNSQPVVKELTMMNHSANGNTSNKEVSANIKVMKVDRKNDNKLPIVSNTSNYHQQIQLNEVCQKLERSDCPLPVVNLRLSIEAYQKHNILNVTASSSNFIFSNEFERRNHESWNDISSSQPIVNESMMKHAANGNTSNLTLISNNNEELKVDINNEKDLSIFSNTSNYHRILLNEICQKQETSDCSIPQAYWKGLVVQVVLLAHSRISRGQCSSMWLPTLSGSSTSPSHPTLLLKNIVRQNPPSKKDAEMFLFKRHINCTGWDLPCSSGT
ncbi:Glycosyltransferase family 61 protein [Euphorbia peplus]|nr:Glycosyltransferase family 61 protein [Euphorbia peplus]